MPLWLKQLLLGFSWNRKKGYLQAIGSQETSLCLVLAPTLDFQIFELLSSEGLGEALSELNVGYKRDTKSTARRRMM